MLSRLSRTFTIRAQILVNFPLLGSNGVMPSADAVYGTARCPVAKLEP